MTRTSIPLAPGERPLWLVLWLTFGLFAFFILGFFFCPLLLPLVPLAWWLRGEDPWPA